MLRRPFKSPVNKAGDDPFVRACMAHYAFNLAGKIDIEDEYLWILLRILPEEELHQLCNWLKSRKFSVDAPTRYLKHPAALHHSVEEVLMDIHQSVYSLTRKDFERHIVRLFAEWFKGAKSKARHNETRELKQLQEMFGLNDEEKEVIRLLYCIQVLRHLALVFNANRVTEFMRLVSAATRIPFRRVQRLLSGKSDLIRKGLVLYKADEKERKYWLLDVVMDFLSGAADVPLKERFIKEDKTRRYDLASFNIDESATAIIQSLLLSDKPCNLLLYGRPGTGKTEYAKAVIASIGGTPCFFQHGDSSAPKYSAGGTELINIRAALNLIPEERGVLIVDEADSLLNTRYFMLNGTAARSEKLRSGFCISKGID